MNNPSRPKMLDADIAYQAGLRMFYFGVVIGFLGCAIGALIATVIIRAHQ